MRHQKSIQISIIILAVLILQAAAGATKYPFSVKDCRGKTVTISSEPKRVISLTPNNTEILFAIGAGSRIIGVTNWSDYPAAAKKISKVGDRIISIERVVSMKPDLVLAHGFLNDDAVRSLEKHGIKVFVINPESINEVANDIQLIGKIMNKESKAKTEAGKIRNAKMKVQKLCSKYKSKPKVLVSVQADPLWAAGPKTFVDEMIRVAGGVNLTGGAKPGFNQFSTEAAVSLNPDIIIGTTKGDKRIFTNGQWRITKAAKTGKVYEANPDLLVRPGPRLADGIYAIARLVHPDANIKK